MNYILEVLEQDRHDSNPFLLKWQNCRAKSLSAIKSGNSPSPSCSHRNPKTRRQQKIESNWVLLKHIYAKPFMRYDNIVLGSRSEQFFIIYEELLIFKRKLIALMNFFYQYSKNLNTEVVLYQEGEDTWHNLYDDIATKLK